MKKLYRAKDGKVIGGVCLGLARYFDVDVTIIRLLWVLAVLLGGTGLLAYLIAWIIMPPEPVAGDEIIVGARQEGTGGPVSDSRAAGLIIVAIGVFFLLHNLFPFVFIRHLWPLVLVAAGLVLIFGGIGGRRS